MGYIRHHAIVVVGWDGARVAKAHEKAVSLEMQASEVITSHVNAYHSFFVAPDGSKEGWEDSEEGDRRRAEFIAWLKTEPDIWLDWAEVELDSDGDAARIGRHAWSSESDQKTKRKAKPPTRQTPTPTYYVAPLRRIEMLGLTLWPVMLNDKRTIGFGLNEASAKKICRALNASRSKGKP